MQKNQVLWKVTTLGDDGQIEHSQEQRRYWANQAIASAMIEGFVPDKAFLDDYELVIQKKMTDDDAVARCIERGAKGE